MVYHLNMVVLHLLIVPVNRLSVSIFFIMLVLQKLKDVQAFLGLPVMDLTSRQVKIHKGSLSDHVMNWEDINKTLNGTAYESFLQADY